MESLKCTPKSGIYINVKFALGSVAELVKALDLSFLSFPMGVNPREFESRRYHFLPCPFAISREDYRLSSNCRAEFQIHEGGDHRKDKS